MPFSPDQIAHSIADRLVPVIPEEAGVTLTVVGSTLGLDDGRVYTGTPLADFGEGGVLSAGEAETATVAALDTISDYVSESLTLEWPGPGPNALGGAAVRGGVLNAWFGPEEAPVLRLDGLAECSPSSIPPDTDQ